MKMLILMPVMAAAIAAGCSTTDGGSVPADDAPGTAAAPAPTQAASSRPAQGPAKPLPAGVFQVQVAEIPDTGSAQPKIAARVLLPVGWRGQGGARWATSAQCQDPATFAWEAVAPDGVTKVELFPTEGWQASNSGLRLECQPGTMQDMRSYLIAYITRRFPGAVPGDYRPRPDFMDAQREHIQARIAMVNNAGVGMRAWADAGELLYTARDNGTEVSGLVAASGMFYLSQAANPLGGPPLMSLTAATNGTFGARAPKGQLDLGLVEAIRRSVKLDGAWAAELMKLQTDIGSINVQGTKTRAAIIVAGGAAITAATIAANNAATQGYADRMATSDRMQRERIEAIRGVETYNDPLAGGTVQLDNNFDHAWRVSDSESYILTKDPNFDPAAFNIEAQRLQVAQ
jgi:hypothetical protein